MNSDAQLCRFPATVQPRLRALVDQSERIGDLAHSFPLLLFMIGDRYGPAEWRNDALDLVERGRPLHEAAKAMHVPFSLRHLPPEAVHGHLAPFAWSGDATRVLAAHIPSEPAQLADWTAAIFFAGAATGLEEFATWIARPKALYEGNGLPVSTIMPLALYAWHSCAADHPHREAIYAPWQSSMRLQRAVQEARDWMARMKLMAYVGETGLHNVWVPGGATGPWTFEPLVRPRQLLDEALAMSNCVVSYVDRMVMDCCRIYSVRCRGERVATLEIVPAGFINGKRAPMAYVIAQIKGPRNADVGEDVRAAAEAWLGKHQPERAFTALRPGRDRLEANMMAMFKPYLAARRGSPLTANIDWRRLLTPSRLLGASLALLHKVTQSSHVLLDEAA